MIYLAPVAVIIGYVLGSFPTAYIIGRLRKGIDIRRVGSHNMGAMNVLGQVGVAEGILVLLVDAGKGIAAILLARPLDMPQGVELLVGAAAAVGHRFPVFVKFRGGKSGAISVGMLFLLIPRAIPFYFGATIAALLTTRHAPFSYITALICFPFAGWFVYHSAVLLVFSLALILFVVINHRSTIEEIRQQGFRKAIMRRGVSTLQK